jgi:hypothetical protein
LIETNDLYLDTGHSQQGNVHWIVPRTVNDLFTGRTKLLLRIRNALHYKTASFPDKQKRFVITGLGGLGKSEICLKVASQMREEYGLLLPLILHILSQLITIGSGGCSGSMLVIA